jgi:hypothetical protein
MLAPRNDKLNYDVWVNFVHLGISGSPAVGILRMLGESFAFAVTKGTVGGSNYMDFEIKYNRECNSKSSIAI